MQSENLSFAHLVEEANVKFSVDRSFARCFSALPSQFGSVCIGLSCTPREDFGQVDLLRGLRQ